MLNCPKCQNILTTIDYEGIEVETCTECKGEWLDAKELGHVVKVREERFDEQARRAIAESTTVQGVKLAGVDRGLKCPKCGGTTEAINYGGDTGIIIDRCAGCGGFWLDDTELEKVQMLVEGWNDQLPADLAKYGPQLKDLDHGPIEIVKFKRMPGMGRFLNALVNGIIDLKV